MDVAADERGWPLIVGADRQTWAAVRQALRDGRTTSPRVDALVRDWQRRWQTRRWLLPVSVVFYLGAIAWSDDLGLRLLIATGTVLILAGVWRAEVTHRRLRRYRGLVTDDDAEH
jgi:hypothetical protein